MNSGQKIGQGPPPPSFGQNPKEQLLFSGNLPLAPLVIIVTLAAPCSTHFISHAQNTWLELQCNTVSEFFKSNKTFVQSEKGWITVKYAAS